MEPLTEKHRSIKDSFSEDEDSEDDIIVHGADHGPSTEDRQLLNEEEEREKLLTKRRKVLIGSKRNGLRGGNHERRKSMESEMEDGTFIPFQRRSKIKVQSIPRNLSCPRYFAPFLRALFTLLMHVLETTLFCETDIMLSCHCIQSCIIGDCGYFTCPWTFTTNSETTAKL